MILLNKEETKLHGKAWLVAWGFLDPYGMPWHEQLTPQDSHRHRCNQHYVEGCRGEKQKQTTKQNAFLSIRVRGVVSHIWEELKLKSHLEERITSQSSMQNILKRFNLII